jgi:hypothetical protein
MARHRDDAPDEPNIGSKVERLMFRWRFRAAALVGPSAMGDPWFSLALSSVTASLGPPRATSHRNR